MRMVFGVLALLVVVASVASIAKQQLQAVGSVTPPAAPGAAPPTVAEGAKQVQQRVADDVNKLMQQAPQRASDAE